jgi:hypothetical protein
MYLSTPLVASWLVVTIGVLAFGIYARNRQRKHEALLKQAKRSLQKLESKNGKLWHEVLKTRAAGHYKDTEITLTSVTGSNQR